MLKSAILSLSLICCAGLVSSAHAEDVDDVLKTSGAASEQSLDAAAEKIIADETSAQKAPIVAPPAATATAPTPAAVTPEKKAVAESQIPAFRDDHAAKSAASNPWYRLIGSAIFILLIAASLIVGAKKYSKKKNVGGSKARIEVLHQHFLGPKKSLALIQVAGEAMLIGITDTQINMIKQVALIDDEVPAADFHGFLEEEFTVENLTAQKSRTRVV